MDLTSGRSRRAVLSTGAAALAGVAGCTGGDGTPTDGSALALTSPVFESGGVIPERFARAGENVNPPLSVAGVPAAADALALLVDDPDAPGGVFTHWLVWNVSPETTTVPAGWEPPEGVGEGTTDFGTVGYEGPAPPEEHSYRFRLFALASPLELPRGAEREPFLSAVEEERLARATLRGRYGPEGG